VFAQAKYGLEQGDGKVCPALRKVGDVYNCLRIEHNPLVKKYLVNGFCSYPDLPDSVVKNFDVVEVVREYFPKATEDEIDNILWTHTGYPTFWRIPDDGWSEEECLRKQLGEAIKLLKPQKAGVTQP
jgi:hypothetical protein